MIYLEDRRFHLGCKWLIKGGNQDMFFITRLTLHLGDFLTMVINHLLNGMILRVEDMDSIYLPNKIRVPRYPVIFLLRVTYQKAAIYSSWLSKHQD